MKKRIAIILAVLLILSMSVQTAFAASAAKVIAEPYDTAPYWVWGFDSQDKALMYNYQTEEYFKGSIENGKYPVSPEKYEVSYDEEDYGGIADDDNWFWDDNGNVGFKDDSGKVIFQPGSYDYFSYYSELGLIEIGKGDLCGIADITGEVILPVSYTYINPVCAGKYFIVRVNMLYGAISAAGKTVIPVNNEYVTAVADENDELVFFCVDYSDGKSAVLRPDGSYVVPPEYNYTFASRNWDWDKAEYFLVYAGLSDTYEALYGLVDKKGNFIYELGRADLDFIGEYLRVYDYEQGMNYILDSSLKKVITEDTDVYYCGGAGTVFFETEVNGKWTVVDEKGATVMAVPEKFQYCSLSYLGNGYFAIYHELGLTVVNMKGEIVIDTNYEYAFDLFDGRYLGVWKDGSYGIVDILTAQTIIPCDCDYIYMYTSDYWGTDSAKMDEVYAVTRNGKDGIYGKDGKVIVPCEYYSASQSSDGFYYVYDEDGNCGLYSRTGVKICDPKYDSINPIEDGKYFEVTLYEDGERLCGILDASGKVVLPVEYDYISGINTDFYEISKGYKSGVTDADFNVLIEPQYSVIYINPGESEFFTTSVWDDESEAFGIIQLSANPFTDVAADAYYYRAVQWARHYRVTSGTSATTFSPDKTCNRAQVVTFLWNAAGQPEPETTVNPFKDVKATDWYYKAVLWAVEEGITSGYTDGTFRPTADCTNAHVLTFLWNFMGQPETESDSNWYSYGMNWAKANGLNEGITGADNPSAVCPRKNIVTFMFRYFDQQ